MKKTSKHALTALAVLAVFTFSGCAQAAITTEAAAPPSESTAEMTKDMRLKPIPLSFSAGERDAQDFEVEQEEEASTLDAAEANAEAIDPVVQENELQSQADTLPAQANPETAAQQEQQEPAGRPVQELEPIPPAAEITIVTQQPEPAPQPAPEPPAPVPEPTPDPAPTPAPAPAPAFDVSACVQNVKNYGVGIGLTLDSTATACWDNPTRANAQSLYAERDLCGLLDWYKASGFTAFWVWAEADGNGGYLVYIGYA